MHSPTLLVLLSLAAIVRLTRLVTADAVLDPLRARVDARAETSPRADRLAYFLQCPWCVSVWAGSAVAGAVYAWHAYWPVQVALIAAAGSLTAGLVHLVIERLEASS